MSKKCHFKTLDSHHSKWYHPLSLNVNFFHNRSRIPPIREPGVNMHKSTRLSLVGQKFNRLTVIAFSKLISYSSDKSSTHTAWECLCDCGNTKIVIGSHLTRGRVGSCGCLRTEAVRKPHSHGMSKTPEYHAWAGIRQRCHNPNCDKYADYGGRGITVCDRWRNTPNGFANFLSDMGLRPSPEYTLDRYPNNDGNYEPGNVRWATWKEQANNKHRRVPSSISLYWQWERHAEEVGA